MQRHNRTGLAPVLAVAMATGLLAACAGGIGENEAPTANYGCLDDSRQCIEQRQATLKGLLADKNRGWVKEPATISSYASGVRLFAFKTEKPRLSCDELAVGRREADNAPGALRGPTAQGLSPAQVARGVMLAGEVGKELGVEQKRRCRA